MSPRAFSSLLVLALIVIGAANSLFVVDQRERALVLAFGEVKRDAQGNPLVYQPGLHFRMPGVDSVVRLDARIQNMEGDPDRVVTAEKKDVIVDSFVKWQVSDFAKFYLTTNGDPRNAQRLLERMVENGLRTEFGQRTIRDLVAGERLQTMTELLTASRASAQDLGINVVDIRIKQINLPNEVSDSVYSRMRSERQQKATELRSNGQKQANIIRTKTDADVKVLIAQSDQESRKTRGDGDAQAAKISADTYKQNPEFYAFLRSLEAYRATFRSEQDVMVMQPDSEFFKYMKKPGVK